jgi:uncharacterized SAM-binding protein YcdF (DUF218 family)
LLLVFLWVSAWLAARWLIVSAPLERADAIVMLSGGSTFVERAELAARLYREGHAAKIILTNDNYLGGWSNTLQRNPFYYERAVARLRLAGVPASAIEVIPDPVYSTYDEAVLLRGYSDSHALKSILIVTSAYHTRRARRTFQHILGSQVRAIGIVGAAPGWQAPRPATWWLHLRGWQMVPGEYLKLIYYEFEKY